ncbi:lipoyl(octanoyl) transferase LipB [Planctomicrobium sp. SH668]|uniref:lipoyl(octanoyl) transferase LipB n=1 Tax=Planctomicrobium sp. SH668 TaxID=3448126 RepID=UPI003F5BBDC7
MTTSPSSMTQLAVHDGTLEVHLLGVVDFDATLALQEQQVYELSGRDDLNGMLFVCEHPVMITMGREASRMHLRLDEDELAQREIPVRWIARGGGAYVHGPGQIALYLQIPLNRLKISPTQYRDCFESAVSLACQELRVSARLSPDGTGIWSRNGQMGFFGAAIKSWISCHGLFLNVSLDPRLLDWTMSNPQGTRSASMQSQRLDPVRMPQLREALIRSIARNFGYASVEVSTGHPFLRRTTQRVMTHA